MTAVPSSSSTPSTARGASFFPSDFLVDGRGFGLVFLLFAESVQMFVERILLLVRHAFPTKTALRDTYVDR